MIDAGKVVILPKGVYDPTVQYEALDFVAYGSCSYLCKQACKGITPADNPYWMCCADFDFLSNLLKRINDGIEVADIKLGNAITSETSPSGSMPIGTLYINTATDNMWKLKGQDSWELKGNIKGSRGDKGDNGKDGNGITTISVIDAGKEHTIKITQDNGNVNTFIVRDGDSGEGTGDMLKSVYDKSNLIDGVVDYSENIVIKVGNNFVYGKPDVLVNLSERASDGALLYKGEPIQGGDVLPTDTISNTRFSSKMDDLKKAIEEGTGVNVAEEVKQKVGTARINYGEGDCSTAINTIGDGARVKSYEIGNSTSPVVTDIKDEQQVGIVILDYMISHYTEFALRNKALFYVWGSSRSTWFVNIDTVTSTYAYATMYRNATDTDVLYKILKSGSTISIKSMSSKYKYIARGTTEGNAIQNATNWLELLDYMDDGDMWSYVPSTSMITTLREHGLLPSEVVSGGFMEIFRILDVYMRIEYRSVSNLGQILYYTNNFNSSALPVWFKTTMEKIS